MNKSREVRTGRHCVSNMHIHMVFVTKYRHCVQQGSLGRYAGHLTEQQKRLTENALYPRPEGRGFTALADKNGL